MKINNYKYSNGSDTFSAEYRKAISFYEDKAQHFHDKYEIFYLLSGDRYYFIKDRTYYIKKGDLVFINATDLHRSTGAEINNYERLLIHFKTTFISPFDNPVYDSLFVPFQNGNHVIRLNIREQNYVENVLFKLVRETQEQRSGFEAYVQALLMELLISADRLIEEYRAKDFEHISPMHKNISEITQYINDNYMNRLTLSSISSQFFISPYHLTRVFKEVTGFTFIEYLNTVRVKEAQILLTDPHWKIIEISAEVGFGSISHFNRVFKNVAGCSPLRYRHTNRM